MSVHFWSFDRKTYTWSSPKSSHSWNPADFTREIRRISWNPWNLADFTHEIWQISPMKSGRFHEIHEIQWISPWNLADFMKSMKSSGFHPWNPADFTQISPVKSTQNYKSKCFSKKLFSLMNAGWGISPLKSTRFHLWNPPKIIKASVSAKTLQFDECRVGAMTKDFMKFTLKSGGFHPWNLADFTQISPVKST